MTLSSRFFGWVILDFIAFLGLIYYYVYTIGRTVKYFAENVEMTVETVALYVTIVIFWIFLPLFLYFTVWA